MRQGCCCRRRAGRQCRAATAAAGAPPALPHSAPALFTTSALPGAALRPLSRVQGGALEGPGGCGLAGQRRLREGGVAAAAASASTRSSSSSSKQPPATAAAPAPPCDDRRTLTLWTMTRRAQRQCSSIFPMWRKGEQGGQASWHTLSACMASTAACCGKRWRSRRGGLAAPRLRLRLRLRAPTVPLTLLPHRARCPRLQRRDHFSRQRVARPRHEWQARAL